MIKKKLTYVFYPMISRHPVTYTPNFKKEIEWCVLNVKWHRRWVRGGAWDANISR